MVSVALVDEDTPHLSLRKKIEEKFLRNVTKKNKKKQKDVLKRKQEGFTDHCHYLKPFRSSSLFCSTRVQVSLRSSFVSRALFHL